VMGAATAVSRVLGFGRVLVIAAVLGTTDLGNTFSASNSVSNVLFDLLAAGALSAVLVPAFVELLDRRAASAGGAEAEQLAGALLGWSLVVLGPICLAGVLAAPALARLLTTGTADPVVAAGQRHLGVDEGQRAIRRRDEVLALDHREQRQHALVQHVPGADLLLDHVEAGLFDVHGGLPVRDVGQSHGFYWCERSATAGAAGAGPPPGG